MDEEPFDHGEGGRGGLLGLVLTAILLIGCGLGVMMWDDRRDREAGSVTLAVP
ncbi:MAG TPA: hypothetical protein VLL04_02755 [Rhizomicrobium sp.]|jgi:hypothetical protein|nr:hypothetical protein [Rhizomicrobium sp.]